MKGIAEKTQTQFSQNYRSSLSLVHRVGTADFLRMMDPDSVKSAQWCSFPVLINAVKRF